MFERRVAQLSKKLAKWKAEGITNYDFTITQSCFCPPAYRGPYRIKVRNGVTKSVKYVGEDDATPVDDGKAYFTRSYGTMTKVFKTIRKRYGEAPTFGTLQKWKATYDAELSYVKSFTYDIAEIADEEQYITVSDFKALS